MTLNDFKRVLNDIVFIDWSRGLYEEA
jgi:hypothetical protein